LYRLRDAENQRQVEIYADTERQTYVAWVWAYAEWSCVHSAHTNVYNQCMLFAKAEWPNYCRMPAT